MIPRLVASILLLAVLVTGPLSPVAVAQPAPAAPARAEGPDAYDVGAGLATAVKAPLKGVLCVLGATGGLLLFVITFGTAARPAASLAEEGCGGSWVVHGEDLRPAPGAALDRTSPRGWGR